ncbi:acireductone dioxygenase 1 [Brevipalpus obovatus]|uniref:acireductone dioxygenase 1 n=1 Tax=Brevipalpus obovatus TaxID=246614 RepID=UPI003D9DBD9C
MVRAWLFNDDGTDQRLPHKPNPEVYIDLEELKQRSGVSYWKLDADNYEEEGKLAKIRAERGYNYSDMIECTPEKMNNYEETLKRFFQEHIHADEEIRFVLDGSGYFDVRDTNDQWIRILVEKGDLIVLPPGIYHRFTLDEKNYAKVTRLFCGEPVWTAINRPADEHPARQKYLQMASENFKESVIST